MTSEPTKLTDTPPTTVWSNDVAGGGVEVDDIAGVAGSKEGQVSSIPTSSSSKKKKKKKKQQQQQQQQQQKDKVEEGVKVEGDDDEDDAETPEVVEEVINVSIRTFLSLWDCSSGSCRYLDGY
jgi:hypothetical protein